MPPTPEMNLLERDYNVHILMDGDVTVVEHWQIQVANSPVPKLSLEIYTGKTNGITFGHVTSGLDQTEQHTTKHGQTIDRISWRYAPLAEGMVSFDIPYTLHGALGMNDQHAWLDWHFLGDDITTSSEQIDLSSRVTIVFPAPLAADAFQINASYPEQRPTVDTIDQQTVEVVLPHATPGYFLEIMAEFPRSLIANSLAAPSWQTGLMPPQIPAPPIIQPSETDIWTILVLGGLALGFLIIGVVAWPYLAPAVDRASRHEIGQQKARLPLLRRPLTRPPHIIQPGKPKKPVLASRVRPHRHTHRQHLSDA